jgi:hypothetical protein
MTGPQRIAILGTPSAPEAEWTSAALLGLVDRGFTGIQLNIAWSYRPADEVLNLEDLVPVPGAPPSRAAEGGAGNDRRAELIATRARLAHAAGLRTLLHIGLPYQGRAGFDGDPLPQCISDPATLHRYQRAFEELSARIPDLDDLLIYTYDQDAWLCSEFDGCDACRGVPLHERLAPFLRALADTWQRRRPGARLWWEPWELSAGQALATIQRLAGAPLGLMLHSNIGEVISVDAADTFLRNAARTAQAAGLPVIAEVFLSSSNEEVEPWRHLPVPLVTVAQLRAVEAVPGVAGVKEYFGLRPDPLDVNALAADAYFADPAITDEHVLQQLAQIFDRPWLADVWRAASDAYTVYPWDASWFTRQLGRSQPVHALTAATIRGAQTAASAWDTPAWRSTRHSVFMRVDNTEPHPWLLEDVQLRCQLAADSMASAVRLLEDRLLDEADAPSAHLRSQAAEMRGFITRARAHALHIRITVLAALARQSGAGRVRHRILAEIRELLDADATNQSEELAQGPLPEDEARGSALQRAERWVVDRRTDVGLIQQAIATLDRDPTAFLEQYFTAASGVAEAGQFSLTSR